MPISNSKAKNVTSKMLNSCRGGALMSRRKNSRTILQIMSIDPRFVSYLSSYVIPHFSINMQINTCESQHDALVRANTRSYSGYAVSGTSLVICSRHCMIRKNGAGDLTKGEACVHSSFRY